MNVELLRKIQQHIKEEPRRYSFDWASESDKSPCGTQACIAGWAMVLSGKRTIQTVTKKFDGLWCSRDAAEILEIDSKQASRLFVWWPREFYVDNPLDAVERIALFIESKGEK